MFQINYHGKNWLYSLSQKQKIYDYNEMNFKPIEKFLKQIKEVKRTWALSCRTSHMHLNFLLLTEKETKDPSVCKKETKNENEKGHQRVLSS